MADNYKIMLIGPSGVGKTSIKERFCSARCPDQHNRTQETSFGSKANVLVNDTPSIVKLCDTDDLSSTDNLNKFACVADAIILVYDIGNLRSFQHIKLRLEQLKGFFKTKKCDEPVLMLVGNKKDLGENEHSQRKVQTTAGELFAEWHDMLFKEVSARAHNHVDSMVIELAAVVKKKREEQTSKREEEKWQINDWGAIIGPFLAAVIGAFTTWWHSK